MADKYIKIQTPEKVVLTYNIASLPMRGIALLADSIIKIGIFILTLYLFYIIDESLYTESNLTWQFVLFIYFIQSWFYMLVLSYLFSGSTPGKMLTGLKVIKNNAEPLDFSTLVIRNISRGIDKFPIFHLLGFLIALIDQKRRRLGDFAAGTLVVTQSRRVAKFSYEFLKYKNDDFTAFNLKGTTQLSEKDLYYLKLLLIKNEKEQTTYNLNSFAQQIQKKIQYKEQILDSEQFLYAVFKHNTFIFKTESDLFISENIEQWNKLDSIIKKLRLGGKLNGKYKQSIIELPELYRKVCGDLSYARGKRLSPDITEYLNELAGRAHMLLYSRQSTNNGFITFVNNSFIFSFINNWKIVLIAFVLFFGSMTSTIFYTMQAPENASFFLSNSSLNNMKEMYKSPEFGTTSKKDRIDMALYYIQNNTTVAFLTFAAGLLLGLGSIYFLVYNGLTIGAVLGYLISTGYGRNIGHFITAHSVFELTAIVLAGAAGMKVGFIFFKRAKYSLIDVIDKEKENIASLITVFMLFLFLAAIIEGLISPSGAPWFYKLTTAIFSLTFIVIVFFIIPFIKKYKYKHLEQRYLQ